MSASLDLALGLRALRAPQWLHFLPLPLAGTSPLGLVSGTCSFGPLLWGLAAAAFGLAHAYGLNAYVERGSDRPGPKNPLVGARPGPLAAAPALLCGGLCLLAGWRSGGLPAAALCVGAGLLYSAGPRLKRRPWLGTLTNAALFAPLLALVGGPAPPDLPGLQLLFVALLLQNQLLHERADLDEDRRAGARTTAALLGPGGTRRALAALALLGGALAWPRCSAAAWTAGALGLVLGAALAGHPDPARARRLHRALALLAGAAAWALGGSP